MQDKLENIKLTRLIQLLIRLCNGHGVRLAACVFLVVQFMPARLLAENENQSYEHKIKAAYLYNFTKFTKWPLQQTSEHAGTTFGICILGQDPLVGAIERLNDKTTAGYRVVVTIIDNVPQKNQCQLLYISQSEKHQLSPVLQAVAELPVLTVSDMEGFIVEGGCIELAMINGKVIFNINLQAVQRAQLKMSAQLLELAKVVIDK